MDGEVGVVSWKKRTEHFKMSFQKRDKMEPNDRVWKAQRFANFILNNRIVVYSKV